MYKKQCTVYRRIQSPGNRAKVIEECAACALATLLNNHTAATVPHVRCAVACEVRRGM